MEKASQPLPQSAHQEQRGPTVTRMREATCARSQESEPARQVAFAPRFGLDIGRIRVRSDVDALRQHVVLGVGSPTSPLPFADHLHRSFEEHDLRRVRAHVGPEATASAGAVGALAFTVGEDVVFAGCPSLYTVAHEAAHVVQQRSGLRIAGGVGQVGDAFERNADAVADRVVRGLSATDLLDPFAATGGSCGELVVQRREASAGGELYVPSGVSADSPEPDPEPSPPDPAALQVELPDELVRELASILQSGEATGEKIVTWLTKTLKDPQRASKIVSFTLKLRDELPKAIAYYQGRVTAETERAFAANNYRESAITRAIAEQRAETSLFVRTARRAETVVGSLHALDPGAEKLAIQVRTATGYLTADYKTIGRHVFLTSWAVALAEVSKHMEVVAQRVVERTIFAKLSPLSGTATVEQLLEREIGLSRSIREFDAIRKGLLDAIEAPKLRRAREAAAVPRARPTTVLRPGVPANTRLEGEALAVAVKEAENGGLLTRGRTVRAVSNVAAKVVDRIDRGVQYVVRERYTAKVYEALRSLPIDAIAEKVASGAQLTTTVAAEVRPLIKGVVAGAAKYAGPIAAGISAAVTVTKSIAAHGRAEQARNAGDEDVAQLEERIAWIEGVHAATDASAAIPGYGTLVAIGGDVVFISVVWILESHVAALEQQRLTSYTSRRIAFAGIEAADQTAQAIRALSDDQIRAISFADKVRLMIRLANFAVGYGDVLAFQRLYYNSDAETGPRLRAAVEPHLVRAINPYQKVWLNALRGILDGSTNQIVPDTSGG